MFCCGAPRLSANRNPVDLSRPKRRQKVRRIPLIEASQYESAFTSMGVLSIHCQRVFQKAFVQGSRSESALKLVGDVGFLAVVSELQRSGFSRERSSSVPCEIAPRHVADFTVRRVNPEFGHQRQCVFASRV